MKVAMAPSYDAFLFLFLRALWHLEGARSGTEPSHLSFEVDTAWRIPANERVEPRIEPLVDGNRHLGDGSREGFLFQKSGNKRLVL